MQEPTRKVQGKFKDGGEKILALACLLIADDEGIPQFLSGNNSEIRSVHPWREEAY